MQRSQAKRDTILGVVIACAGIAYAALAQSQVNDIADISGMTGRHFPYLIAFLTMLCGGLLSLSSLKKMQRDGERGEAQTTNADKKGRLLRLSVYTGAIALYCAGVAWIGFFVSSLPAMFFLMWFSGAKAGMLTAVLSILVTAAVYAIFVIGLKTPMPATLLF